MAITRGKLSKTMKDFIVEANKLPIKDQNKAIEAWCDNLEGAIYEMIKQITIVIPPGAIKVVGSPSAQTNAIPITIDLKAGAKIL
jgi:hypothetical protein